MLTRSRIAATGCALLLTAVALKAADEAELWARRDRDPTARQELVGRYHFVVGRVVRNVIRRLRLPERIDADEIVSDLYETYVRTIDRYDPTRGVRPETFLDRRLRWAAIDWLGGRVSAERRLQAAEQEFEAHPSPTTSARLAATRSAASLAAPASLEEAVQGKTDRALVQVVEAEMAAAPPPFDRVDRAHVADRLRADLQERPWSVIAAHYLLGWPLDDIASGLGLTPSYVQDVHRRALQDLRETGAGEWLLGLASAE